MNESIVISRLSTGDNTTILGLSCNPAYLNKLSSFIEEKGYEVHCKNNEVIKIPIHHLTHRVRDVITVNLLTLAEGFISKHIKGIETETRVIKSGLKIETYLENGMMTISMSGRVKIDQLLDSLQANNIEVELLIMSSKTTLKCLPVHSEHVIKILGEHHV